jgi:predicted flap endonuclease-1-like 5' DNA nuclease
MMQSSISLCDLPWWAVLLSWLAPALLGYLWGMLQWGRYQSKSKKVEMELSSASRRIVNLEKEINECRLAYEKVFREKEKLAAERTISAPRMPEPQIIGTTPAQSQQYPVFQEIIHETKAIFGYAIRKNDLKIIEGIDPKIERILQEVGIHDWSALETTDINYLQALLEEKGYHRLDPSTWPYQSSLARQYKWEELKNFQAKK